MVLKSGPEGARACQCGRWASVGRAPAQGIAQTTPCTTVRAIAGAGCKASFHHNQSMVTLRHGNLGDASRWKRAGVVSATVVVWALALGSALYWGLQLTSPKTTTLAPPQVVAAAPIDPQVVAKALGARAASPIIQASLASRFVLQGVVAGGAQGGAALIAVDGKPARTFAVGSAVDDALVIQSANARSVTLAQASTGATVVTLNMPLLK